MIKNSLDEFEIEDFPVNNDDNTIETTIQNNRDYPTNYSNLSILALLKNNNDEDSIEVPYDNALYMYLDELKNASMLVSLDDGQYTRYKYRPDLLSFDLYGTMEYDYVLLALNDIISPKYFDKKVIRVIHADYIQQLVSLIADSESDYIQLNRSTYKDE